MRNKNILVTGGAGYVGSHACKLLKAGGYNPVVVDDLSNGHLKFALWGPIEVGDFGNEDFINSVFKKYHPIAIIHFAAFAYVGESTMDPAKYYLNNVAKTIHLLNASRNYGIKYFVFSSSCAVYGSPQNIPISEKEMLSPISPYGHSKLMVEKILNDFCTAYGVNNVSLRYFNAAGADFDLEVGELHSPETHLIPLVLDVALHRLPSIGVYGNDYQTPDGSCIRDYIHVLDLAKAHIASLEYLLQGGQSVSLNLGAGKGYSVLEVIDMVKRVTGRPIKIILDKRRPGDPASLIANTSSAQKILNWRPSYSELDLIIESAWAWHKKIHKEEA